MPERRRAGLALRVAIAAVLLAPATCGRPAPVEVPATPTPTATVAKPAIALTGRVTDAADVLSIGEETALSAKLARFERATGHQMVVVSTLSLGGRGIADYTRDLANTWGIGRKGVDDGVVILVAPRQRQVRIEVGRGLETTLSDAFCTRVLEKAVLPRFRDQEYYAGIDAGADALIAAMRSGPRADLVFGQKQDFAVHFQHRFGEQRMAHGGNRNVGDQVAGDGELVLW